MSKWEHVKIDNLCEKKIQTISSTDDFDIEYVDISSVDNKEKRIVSYQTLKAKEAPSRAKQILKREDILVSTVRPNLNAVAINRIDSENVVVGSTGYCVLRCSNKVDVNYLFNYCKSNSFINELVKVAKGASYPAVTNTDVRNCKIPLPLHNIQKQIANTLDTAAEVLTLRKQQLAELDNLISSTFYDMFGDLAFNDKQWAQRELIDICKNESDIKCGPFGTQLSKDEYQTSGVPLWGIPQINTFFKLPTQEFLTREKAKTLEAYSIIPHDITMSRKGNVGKCALYPLDFPSGIMHSDVLRIRVNQEIVNPTFILHQLHLSRYIHNQIMLVSGGAIMAGVNVTKLKRIVLHVPPIEIQTQFATIVAKVDEQKVLIQKAIDETQLIFDSLMSKYFE